jgi:glutamate synthase domain-containing protein 3
MAAMGARTLEELIGRSDLLTPKTITGRASLLDVSALIAAPAAPEERRKSVDIDHNAEETLDTRILARISGDLAEGRPVEVEETICTENRTVGARIAGAMTVLRDANPTPLDRVALRFRGSAGQSFGAFTVPGLTLKLEGEANDYVGKGMSGGEIAIFPDRTAQFTTPQTIAGNTILYGATGGTVFIAGVVGERFAVRNSGATTVVEGVGDHGCEYMTGGQAVILGPTGNNFGAGMTNGTAYVLDQAGTFGSHVNADSVALTRVEGNEAIELRALVQRHVEATGSAHAEALLANWDATLSRFWKVTPTAVLELQQLLMESTEGAAD